MRARVMTPNWPRPPRAAKKRSGRREGEQTWESPSAVTISSSATLEIWGPCRKVCPLIPPFDSVPPTVSRR